MGGRACPGKVGARIETRGEAACLLDDVGWCDGDEGVDLGALYWV
jgi:hypothetical protein